MRSVKENSKKFQTGADLVEFAIVVPILLLLVLGICEFGYAFYHLNILNKSVQDGARYFSGSHIARDNGTDASLSYPINVSTTTTWANRNLSPINKVSNLVAYGNVAGTGAQLLPDTIPATTVYCAEENNASNTICATTTQHIRVTAIYQHNFILGCALRDLLMTFFAASDFDCFYNLTASAVLKVE